MKTFVVVSWAELPGIWQEPKEACSSEIEMKYYYSLTRATIHSGRAAVLTSCAVTHRLAGRSKMLSSTVVVAWRI